MYGWHCIANPGWQQDRGKNGSAAAQSMKNNSWCDENRPETTEGLVGQKRRFTTTRIDDWTVHLFRNATQRHNTQTNGWAFSRSEWCVAEGAEPSVASLEQHSTSFCFWWMGDGKCDGWTVVESNMASVSPG